MGAEPSSPFAQLEHLGNLLRNRVNSQRKPSLYEVWKPKSVEGIEKQTVRRLRLDAKVPGIGTGTEAAVAPTWHLHRILGRELDHQFPSLQEQGGQSGTRRDLDT